MRPSAGTSAARAGAVGPAGPRAGSGPLRAGGKRRRGPPPPSGSSYGGEVEEVAVFVRVHARHRDGGHARRVERSGDGRGAEASPHGGIRPPPRRLRARRARMRGRPRRAPRPPPGRQGPRAGSVLPGGSAPACASRRLARGGGRFRAGRPGIPASDDASSLRRGGLRAPLAAGRCILRPVGAKGGPRVRGFPPAMAATTSSPAAATLGDATGKREAALVAVLRPVSVFGMAVWTVHADNSLAWPFSRIVAEKRHARGRGGTCGIFTTTQHYWEAFRHFKRPGAPRLRKRGGAWPARFLPGCAKAFAHLRPPLRPDAPGCRSAPALRPAPRNPAGARPGAPARPQAPSP